MRDELLDEMLESIDNVRLGDAKLLILFLFLLSSLLSSEAAKEMANEYLFLFSSRIILVLTMS